MLVTYTGKKTAYYNGQSYFPGEVFEAPDRIPVRDDKGNPKKDKDGEVITRPLVIYPENSYSKLRLASEAEHEEYIRKNPRYKRRQESKELIEQQEAKRKRGRPRGGGVLAGVDVGA